MKDQQPAFFVVQKDAEIGKRITYREGQFHGRPSVNPEHEAVRKALHDDVEAFLAAGGAITPVPTGVTSLSDPDITPKQWGGIGAL